MQIIGAGFGRTGTMSLRAALTQLGYRPCYHFLELFKHPEHTKTWQAAAQGDDVDWQKFLGSYKAGLDYPIAGFYKELLEDFPNAKVILTIRDPQKWYDSTKETIYQGTALPAWLLKLLPPFRGMQRMVNAAIWERLFHGKFEDREYAIRVFEEHIEEVRRIVSPDQLLVFDVKDGWKPLCGFLGVPEPQKSFPHINDRRSTRRIYLFARVIAPLLTSIVISILVWFIYATFL